MAFFEPHVWPFLFLFPMWTRFNLFITVFKILQHHTRTETQNTNQLRFLSKMVRGLVIYGQCGKRRGKIEGRTRGKKRTNYVGNNNDILIRNSVILSENSCMTSTLLTTTFFRVSDVFSNQNCKRLFESHSINKKIFFK